MANTIVSSILLGTVVAPALIAGARVLSGKPPIGGKAPKQNPNKVNVVSASGVTPEADTRVKIKVPNQYFNTYTDGPNLRLFLNDGIVFPYTPQITYEHKADYTPLSPMHSNHPIYFYQKSSVTPITIQGKFTVQNEKDAETYLASVHLLRSITKMRTFKDSGAGSPPPVCRLFAHGTFSLDNVPVAISSLRIELPENVDYISTGKNAVFEKTRAPTMSTISVTCIPMFSRTEMQNYNVTEWISSDVLRKSGLL